MPTIIEMGKNEILIREFEREISKGQGGYRPRKDSTISPNFEKNMKQTSRRRRNDVYNLILDNFTENESVFVTLTFANHIDDLEVAHKELKKFLDRYKYKYGDANYVIVYKKQSSSERWHYHIVMSPITTKADVECLWPLGTSDAQIVYSIRGIANYLTENMLDAERSGEIPSGKKAYKASAGLYRRKIIKDDDAHFKSIRDALDHDRHGKIVFSTHSRYVGKYCIKAYPIKSTE